MAGKSIPFALEDDTKMPLRHDLFNHDAVILSNTSRYVSIKSDKTNRRVGMKFDDYEGEIDDVLQFQTGGSTDERQYLTFVEVTEEGIAVTAYQRAEAGDVTLKSCADYVVIDAFEIRRASAQPEQPVQPEQPAQTDKPAQPEQPAQPERPNRTQLWAVLGCAAAVLIAAVVIVFLRKKKTK